MESATLLLRLMSSDANWRNKVLKVLQYAARLSAIVMERSGRSIAALPPATQLLSAAKNLSLARRISVLGDSLIYLRDFLVVWSHLISHLRGSAAAGPQAAPDAFAIVSACMNAASGVVEDVNTCSVVGFISHPFVKSDGFKHTVNVTWALSCLWSLSLAIMKARAALQALHDARSRVLQALHAIDCHVGGSLPLTLQSMCMRAAWLMHGPSAVTRIPSPLVLHGYLNASDAAALRLHLSECTFADDCRCSGLSAHVAAWAKAHVDAFMHALNLVKCICDAVQSVAAAAQVPATILPDYVDTSCGLISGACSCLRLWSAALHAHDAFKLPALKNEHRGEADDMQRAATGGKMSNGTAAAPPAVIDFNGSPGAEAAVARGPRNAYARLSTMPRQRVNVAATAGPSAEPVADMMSPTAAASHAH